MKKTIVISGSSSGLGFDLAKHFYKEGFAIEGCGRSKKKFYFQNYTSLDLRSMQDLRSWIEIIKKKNIFCFINNASVIPVRYPALLNDQDFLNEALDVNIKSQIFLINELSKIMIKNKNQGRIINISSMSSALNEKGTALYSASKVAIEKYLSILSRELSNTKITCNTIGVTYYNSKSFRALGSSIIVKAQQHTNIKRVLNLKEITNVIKFFIKPDSSVITGQKIYLGMSV